VDLKDGSSAGYRGGWSALDAATGAILWETPNPAYEREWGRSAAAQRRRVRLFHGQ